MESLIRVLVVDDHTIVRKGLRALLTPKYGIEVIGEGVDGVEAIEKARALKPDVILMDMVMPRKGGLEAITEIVRKDPDVRIVVLSSFSDDIQIVAAIKAGAKGYVLKDASPDELVNTIQSAYLGNRSLSEEMFRLFVPAVGESVTQAELVAKLTARELDVLRELARGSSNQEIATSLSISIPTVRSHISSILGKLELENRTQAALYAYNAGLIS